MDDSPSVGLLVANPMLPADRVINALVVTEPGSPSMNGPAGELCTHPRLPISNLVLITS